MYDDILGPYKEDETPKTPKNKINLKNKVCYDCGNPPEECECEEGFIDELDLTDLEIEPLDHDCGGNGKDECDEDPWDGVDQDDDGCDDDGGCVGVGCLGTSEPDDCCDDCDCEVPPEQDIGCLEPMSDAEENKIWQLIGNDEGRNCEGQCKTCDIYDCCINIRRP